MSTWRHLIAYCTDCESWADAVAHSECARGASDSAIFLDLDESLLTCGKCHEVWLIEDTRVVCPTCGHVQKIEFRDDMVHLQADDHILASDGAVVYVRMQSGSLLITHRSYIDSGSEE